VQGVGFILTLEGNLAYKKIYKEWNILLFDGLYETDFAVDDLQRVRINSFAGIRNTQC
jgi:hypothetical protein